MFKKKRPTANIRKREEEEEDNNNNTPTEGVVVIKPEQKKLKTINSAQTAATAKRTQSILEEQSYTASGTAASLVSQDMGATATNEIDTEVGKDSLSLAERALLLNEELAGMADDKLYRGQAGYAQYLTTKDKESGQSTTSKIKQVMTYYIVK